MRKLARAVIGAVWLSAIATAGGNPVFDYGCLASSGVEPTGIERFRAVGPIVEWSEGSDGLGIRAVRPLFAFDTEAERGSDILDVLWPVASFRTRGRETEWRILTVFGHNYDNDVPGAAYHVWALPFIFAGRTASGDGYGGVFPLYGRICNFLGRDEVAFVLFPLYGYSRINDQETYSVLWPLFSRTSGKKGEHSFRALPFYAEAEREGEWTKRYVAWPIWSSITYERPGAQGYAYVLFPIFGRVNMENQQSWMVLPPLIRWSTSSRGSEGYLPWPFIQYSAGRTDKLYVWPLWGRKRNEFGSYRFWLWPIVTSQDEGAGGKRTERLRILPFVYSDRESTVASNAPAQVTDRHLSIWPLASYSRTGEESRFRSLCLWPLKNTSPVERNFAPLWTIFDRTRTERGVNTDVLWGLAHWGGQTNGTASASLFPLMSWERGPRDEPASRWSVLKGLFGYERDGDRRRYRLLYAIQWGGEP